VVYDYALPALYTLFLWWFSTGVILYLDGLPRHTFRWSLLGATALLIAALWALVATSSDTTVTAAYVAFTCGVIAWGWNEMCFLMGFLTGPRKQACPEGCRGWRHFGHGIQAILHHELAIIATALVLLALTWDQPNQVGAWTFLILWFMRLSTKLNVFLGVPNLAEEFLPEHLQYLQHFFTRKRMNLLFPFSVTGATLATAWLIRTSLTPEMGAFETVALALMATLMVLAVIEHWFLVLPPPTTLIWGWGLRSHEQRDSGLVEMATAAVPPRSQRSAGICAGPPNS